MRALIRDLDHADIASRDDASSKLSEIGPAVVPYLLEARSGVTSPETKARIAALLNAWMSPDFEPRDEAGRQRAIQVLERIGSPTAAVVLRRFIDELPALAARHEVKAALDKITK